MRFITLALIYSLCILQIKGDKASIVAKFSQSRVGCGFCHGASGEVLTQRLLEQFYRNNPKKNNKNILKKWIGKQVFDEGSFVYEAFANVQIFLCHTANGTWRTSKITSKGPISNYPKDKVLILFKKSGESMSIQGVYVGGGQYVYCKGPKEGVVRGTMPGPWTHWAIPAGLY